MRKFVHLSRILIIWGYAVETLTQEELAYLENLLNQRETELSVDIQREIDQKEDYAQVASEAPDPGDASFADLSIDLGNAAISRDVNELRAVQAARQRLKSGIYGVCIECGYPIPYERLEAQPTAERCAPCQSMYEKTHADATRGTSL